MRTPYIEAIERQAVRILFIVRFCGEALAQTLPLFEEFEYWIESESKLQKLEFWIRYPDYLAYNLLSGLEMDPKFAKRRDEIRSVVNDMFRDREPDIRLVPMQRFLRGAYEPLDRVLAFLVSRSLVHGRRLERSNRNAFYLTQRGMEVVDQLQRNCPETEWYIRRCKLIHSFFGQLSGSRIKQIQYESDTYRMTRVSDVIQQVNSEVRDKYKLLFNEELP